MTNSVTFDQRKPVDFAIIGSGAAGGIIAKELSTAGFDVVVFEQGPYRKAQDFTHDEYSVLFNAELMGGEHAAEKKDRLTDSPFPQFEPFFDTRDGKPVGIVECFRHTQKTMAIGIGFYDRPDATVRCGLSNALKVMAQSFVIDNRPG